MKSAYLSLSLISIATCSVFATFPVAHASAQCIMNDTNFQVSMNGSGKKNDRTNNVSQQSTGSCVGNTVSTTNVQVQTGGTERSTQHRSSSQQLNGDKNSPSGVNLPPVKLRQNVQIDVDNPTDRLRSN